MKMAVISIVEAEYKVGEVRDIEKEYGKLKDSGENISKFPEFLNERINRDIKNLYESLGQNKEVKYSKEEILEMISDKFKKNNWKIGSDAEKLSNPKTHEDFFIKSFPILFNVPLLKWKIYDKAAFNEEENSIEFPVTVDSFEINEFKNHFTALPGSSFSTIRIEPYGDCLLVYILGNPLDSPKFKELIRRLLPSYKVESIKWDDAALRDIKTNLSGDMLRVSAKNVETTITVDASSEGLQDTELYKKIEGGEFTRISYIMKDPYKGYRATINGRYGTVRSGLADDEVIKYIKTDLLGYSSIKHTKQES
jgi:hypothetical protein